MNNTIMNKKCCATLGLLLVFILSSLSSCAVSAFEVEAIVEELHEEDEMMIPISASSSSSEHRLLDVWIPNCSKNKHKWRPQCKCSKPVNWEKEICQGENWWERPEVLNNLEKTGRIVGGEVVNNPRDQYPWFARLVTRSGEWFPGCGGTLIAPEYVLTAAHCVSPNAPWPASTSAVQIGAVCPNESDNCGVDVQQINVESITPHPNYNGNTMNNDFALVKLVSRANATPVAM